MSSFLGIQLTPNRIEFSEGDNLDNVKFLGTKAATVFTESGELTEELKNALKDKSLGLKRNYEGIACSISTGKDFYRKMTFPFAQDQVEKTIQFEFFDEIKESLKSSPDNFSFDYQILNTNEKRTTALGMCSPLVQLQSLIAFLDKMDLDPEKIIPEISTVLSYVKAKIPLVGSGNTLILHTSNEEIFFIVLNQGELVDIRQVRVSLGEIQKVQSVKTNVKKTNDNENLVAVESEYEEEDEFYNITSMTKKELDDLVESEDKEDDELDAPSDRKMNAIRRLLVQIKRTLFLMQTPPQEILITGTYSRDAEVIHALKVYGLSVYEPDENIDLEHAASLGSLITFFDKETKQLNFRTGDLGYKGFFEKVVGPLNFCLLLLLGITGLMIFSILSQKERILIERGVHQAHFQQVYKQLDRRAKVKGLSIVKTHNQIKALNKKLDFEANIREKEKAHPVISCLDLWYEYEKHKNNGYTKKIVLGIEQSIKIRQGKDGAVLSITKARMAGFQEITNFVNHFKKGYFDLIKEKNSQNVGDGVTFDFAITRKHR
ncbi:MAG: hypothetical protein COA79_10130 [Planctomycetota bacterium]|nr:MAG: hypothetical protein COA79_10130 [Planctomycetota bacterium]